MRRIILILSAAVLALASGAQAKGMVSISQAMAAGGKDPLWQAVRCSGYFSAIAHYVRNGGPNPDAGKLEQLSKLVRRGVANSKAEQFGGSYKKYMPDVERQYAQNRRDYVNWLQNHYMDSDPILKSDLDTCYRVLSALKGLD